MLLSFGCSRAAGPALDERRHADDFAATHPADAGSREADAAREAYPVSAFCSDLRAAFVERCRNFGQSGCRAAAREAFGARVCAATARAVRAGRVRYDAERAARCVAERAFDLAAAWQSGWVPPLSCDGMFVGTSALGEVCFPDETFQRVCSEGWCRRDGACPGACTEYAETGEACAPDRCAPGLYCTGEGRCQPELSLGQSCPEGWGCALPAVCALGSCRELAELGEPCATDTPCVYPWFCAEGRCVVGVGPSEPCELDRHCPDGLRCGFLPLGGRERACLQPPKLGDPCDRRLGCARDLECVADSSPLLGTCARASDAGAAEGAPAEQSPEPEPSSGSVPAPERPPWCAGD